MDKLKNGTVEKIGGTSLWRVVSPFYWIIDYNKPDEWIVIANKDFVCNYGSIPRLFRIIFDPTRYNSYVLHDAMTFYQVKYNISTKEYMLLSRKEADLILLEGLAYEGAGFLERICIYAGVRIGGWYSWYFGENNVGHNPDYK